MQIALPDPLPEYLTVDECAALLRIPKRTLYDCLNRGDIPGARRFGKTWRIRRESVLPSLEGDSGSRGQDLHRT